MSTLLPRNGTARCHELPTGRSLACFLCSDGYAAMKHSGVHKADNCAPSLQPGRLQLRLQRRGALQCRQKAAGSLWAAGSRCSERCLSQ